MKTRGMSLLEILIAAGIMIAAMVPLWGLMGSSHKQVTVSADEVRASQLANEILEQIECLGWFPEHGQVSFDPVKNARIKVGSNPKLELEFGEFPDYLEPRVVLEIEKYPASGSFSGRIIRCRLDYKPKDAVGKSVKTFFSTTFVSR